MKSIVLLSAGLDSAVNLALALKKSSVQMAITFDYGQKAFEREALFSRQLASHYGISHQIIELPFYKSMKELGLIKGKVPEFEIEQLDNSKITQKSASQVWIPNRNLVFIAVAAAIAEYHNFNLLVTGFNKEESQTFPDNSSDFLEAVNHSLAFSTKNKVQVSSFTINLNKKEIIEEGVKLGVPWQFIWSCYYGEKLMCGRCESCSRLIRAARGTSAWEVLKTRFQNA